MRQNDWSMVAGAILLIGAISTTAEAQTPVPATGEVGQRLNPTGKTIVLTVPFKEGPTYLGDIDISVTTEDRVEFAADRVLTLLGAILDAGSLASVETAFAGKTVVTGADFEGTGIRVAYNPQSLEVVAEIPASIKAAKALSIVRMDQETIGAFDQPAGFSAYLNSRAAVDYVHQGADDGFDDPLIFLDGAARLGAVAFETEAVWRPGDDAGAEFQRLGSRFVHDNLDHIFRLTVGDLQTVARGYQAAPDMAGVSVFRSYGVLQPQRNVRPRGDQSFRLSRPSNVEVFVNGQLVRRVRLDPGSYNVRDFPFAQGANDVRLVVEDDTGAREQFNFNIFFDRAQLEPGLAEFGLFAGVMAPLDIDGPDYTDNWAISGFYRRGVTDRLTLGANFQADERSRMGGLEGVWGSPLGSLGFDAAASNLDGVGSGSALTVTLAQLYQAAGGQGRSFNLFFETRSRDFAPVGVLAPDNRYAWELGSSYVHNINERYYAGLDARYSSGRAAQPDSQSYRASLGARLSDRLSLTVDGRYQEFDRESDLSVFVSLTTRLSPWSSARFDFDSRDERARASYQTARGQGVGSYALAADLERSRNAGGLNASGSYLANRAELGVSHFTGFTDDFSRVMDARTSVRMATSFAYADGAASIGRPIYDSFALVKAHKALKGAEVYVNPTPDGYSARTGVLGTAIEPQLSAYSERTITVDAPAAPAGFDLGEGSFRVFAPYRGGYRLDVGSDYGVTAIGRLVGEDGEPIALLAGQAIELADPERPPVQLFTNRDGRFGAQGLKPGRWRIEMPTSPPTTFVIDVPADTEGVLAIGDLRPTATGH